MSDNKVIFIGEKESFIARSLINKVNANGVECHFVPWTLNDISAAMEGASLMTLFMSDGKAPSEEVLHFIVDTLVENSMQIIIVGNSADLQYACDHIPRDLIYMTFSRPVDNAVFADAVTEFFIKAGSSEFKKSILIVDDDP